MIDKALKLAIKTSYLQVTATELAAECNTCRATVHNRFGTREQLQAAIVQAAFDVNCLPVMAQAVACNHPLAEKWSVAIRPTSSRQHWVSCSTTAGL